MRPQDIAYSNALGALKNKYERQIGHLKFKHAEGGRKYNAELSVLTNAYIDSTHKAYDDYVRSLPAKEKAS